MRSNNGSIWGKAAARSARCRQIRLVDFRVRGAAITTIDLYVIQTNQASDQMHYFRTSKDLLNRHALLKFFEPVQDDVDLLARRFGGPDLRALHNDEVLAVRCNVVAAGPIERDLLDRQRHRLPS